MKNLRKSVFTLMILLCGSNVMAWDYAGEPQGLPYEEGLGTEEVPFLIKNEQQLANLAYCVNNGSSYSGKYFKLVSDLDFNPGITFDPDNTNSYAGAKAWVPVGAEAGYFAGNFDGDGHTISGLYLNGDNCSSNYVVDGLFGNVKNMTLSNLTITNSLIVYTADENEGITFSSAFFAAESANCNFINLINKGNVRTYFSGDTHNGLSTRIAGIVGRATGSNTVVIRGCENYGSMKMNAAYSGELASILFDSGFCGIIGDGENVLMSDCHNFGELDGRLVVNCWGIGCVVIAPYGDNQNFANLSNSADINGGAGLFNRAQVYGKLIDSYNTGNITNGCGLMNDCQFNILEGCYNTGDIDDKERGGVNGTGGLIGYSDYLQEMTNCYNTGKIKANQTAGGLIGCVGPYEVKITDCYNEGAVETAYSAGGIVGRAFGFSSDIVFENCRNKATVSGGAAAGGLLGYDENYSVTIDSCTNSADIKGSYNVGGLAGRAILKAVRNSSNSGNISVDVNSDGMSYAGGLIGYDASGASESVIEKSFNTGNVAAKGKYAGGIAGQSGCMTECYNTGNITGKSYVSGLAGAVTAYNRPPMLNCYNAGNVSGEDFVAGLCSGITDAARYCFNYGTLECPTDNKATLWIYSYYMNDNYSSDCYALPQEGYEIARQYIGADNSISKKDGCSISTIEEFANGTVCILLNDNQTPTPWGQDISTDSYPLLNGKGNPESGVESVAVEGNTVNRISTISGRLINTDRVGALPCGIYIINGKKVLIK